MSRKSLLFLLLLLLFTQCTSTRKLLQAGEIAKADLTQPLAFDYYNKLLFVDVEVNGQPRRFIIDSGAPNVVDRRLKEELQLQPVKKDKVTDSQNNHSELEFVTIESLAFAGVEARNSTAIVADLSLFHCLGIDGLLGANVMRHFDWEVDYQQQQARLYPKDGTNRWDTLYEIAIPFTVKAQGTPDLEVRAPGWWKAGGVTLDLGSTGGISIHRSDKLQLPRDSSATFAFGQDSKGIYGANTDTTFYILMDSLLIGGQLFQPALVAASNTSNKIGNSFWEQYKLLISWRDNRLYLSPREVIAPQLPSDLLALGFEDGAVLVLATYENLGRLNDQLEFGDVVIQVNGVDTEGISVEDYCALREQEWETLELKVRKKEGEALVGITLRKGEVEW